MTLSMSPSAASKNTAVAGWMSFRIFARAGFVVIHIPIILTPFPNITIHIINAQAICMQGQDFHRAYHAFVAKEKPIFEGD